MSIKQVAGATKTKKLGTDESNLKHQNNPFDAAYIGGHELNHAFKNPVPNASGVNHSYMHPVANNSGNSANTMKLNRGSKMPAGPMRSGKNPV